MTTYELYRQVAELALRVSQLEKWREKSDNQTNRAVLVMVIFIVATVVGAWAGPAAVKTAAVFAKAFIALR